MYYKHAESRWMEVGQNHSSWHSSGEAYVQLWTSTGEDDDGQFQKVDHVLTSLIDKNHCKIELHKSRALCRF